MLEQIGHPVVYASRSLTSLEKQYSVIQRECLAIVFALKQFQHYLLGGHFKILTDLAPLQWLWDIPCSPTPVSPTPVSPTLDEKVVFRLLVKNSSM